MIENESEMRMKNKLGTGLLTIVLMVAGLLSIAGPAQATVCSPNACFGYAGFRQTVNFDGVAVLLGKENPATDAKTWHTLAEVAVTDSTGNNTVEVGWTKDPLVCAAGVTICLFMFNWVGGVPGCYNGCGAINGTGCSPYCLGASLDSIANNTSKNFSLQHLNGAWWAAYDGAWRFAIPDTDWGAAAFSQGAQYQIFGEVAMKDDTSCVDMMQPVLPTGSPTFLGGKANSMTLVNGSAAVAPTAFATSPTKWNALMVTGISGRFSGPGNC